MKQLRLVIAVGWLVGCTLSESHREPTPGEPVELAVALDAERVFVRRDEDHAIVVTIDRKDVTGDVTISAADLPSGVTADPLVIPSDATSGTLQLRADSTATQGVVHVAVTGTIGDNAGAAMLRLLVGGPSGSLDESFGSGGVFIAGDEGQGRGLTLTADGGIIATGFVGNSFSGFRTSTIRLTDTGILDVQFGTAGLATSTELGRGTAIATLADGSVLVAGTFRNSFGLFKYTSAGVPDEQFGDRGVVESSCASGCDLTTLVVEPGGAILVAGRSGFQQLEVLRFFSSGVRDTSYNVSETGSLPFVGGTFLQADGRLVVCGRIASNFGCTRYLAEGVRDPSFGTGGLVTPTFAAFDSKSCARAVIGVADGKLLVIGDQPTAGHVVAARFTSAGGIDPSFGLGGTLTTTPTFSSQSSNAALVDPAGDIVSVGLSGSRPAVQRLTSQGQLDTTFGTNGVAAIDFGMPTSTGGYGIVTDGDQRIVFTGEAGDVNGIHHMVVARLWP